MSECLHVLFTCFGVILCRVKMQENRRERS